MNAYTVFRIVPGPELVLPMLVDLVVAIIVVSTQGTG